MNVSTRSLRFVTNALRAHRQLKTRWRVLSSHQQALMLIAYLKKGETYRGLAARFGVGASTAFRYLREGLQVLAVLARTWNRPSRSPRGRRT
ncbi:hypothetical protein Kisp01_70540 [Kineosporia sp. NBRC 101677]|nr:transposase family protein [Kineosporia sp. NBRC 101677]GLY20040.1 hypothetical protein Kisp01_70540 [Kineosporia sp. NBRC 101677]